MPGGGEARFGDDLGLTQVFRARLTIMNTPGQALPSAAYFLSPEPGQRRRTLLEK